MTSTDAPVITVALTRSDLNEVKKYENFVTSDTNTFLSHYNASFSDTFNNAAVGIESEAALDTDSFNGDSVEPQLESFDLDMNSGTLDLYFSETGPSACQSRTNSYYL